MSQCIEVSVHLLSVFCTCENSAPDPSDVRPHTSFESSSFWERVHGSDLLFRGLQKAVLDRDANCCESGKLDACGACDGTGLLIDVQNV